MTQKWWNFGRDNRQARSGQVVIVVRFPPSPPPTQRSPSKRNVTLHHKYHRPWIANNTTTTTTSSSSCHQSTQQFYSSKYWVKAAPHVFPVLSKQQPPDEHWTSRTFNDFCSSRNISGRWTKLWSSLFWTHHFSSPLTRLDIVSTKHCTVKKIHLPNIRWNRSLPLEPTSVFHSGVSSSQFIKSGIFVPKCEL